MQSNVASRGVLLFAIFVASAFLLVGCNVLDSPDYFAPSVIEYTISGGLAGIHQETIVDENGLAELSHGGFIVHYQLTAPELETLKRRFDEADFFGLESEYIPTQRVADGFSYSIKYSIGNKTKVVSAEDGADYPGGLKRLLEVLHTTNGIILSNPDAGTLLIYWEYMIKEWLFSDDISLADNLQKKVYYSNSEVSRAIFDFFVNIYHQVADDFFSPLYWEADYLYQVTTSGMALSFEGNIGNYFYPVRRHAVRYWPKDFGFELSEIPETGMILTDENLTAVKDYLSESVTGFNVFIYDELKDGGKAVSLSLVSGRPIGSQSFSISMLEKVNMERHYR